ncbi:SDR family oxidoreductase [Nostoc sp. CHAB 5824]|nr:SDR family oxidoreductase [Nostoc sp. CHAB 5824]
MKKLYIAGAGGMLGEAFYKATSAEFDVKFTDKDLNTDWLSFLDFRDHESYVADVKAFQPDYLFHIGAYTDLEFCELNKDDTYRTNTLAVESAVQIANSLDIPLLYISTAGIFDGGQNQYDDWDTPNPLGVYARTKYLGERYVVENCLRYLVCRAGWMMGGGPSKDKKFVQKIMAQIKAGKTVLHIVDDKDGTPTYTHDFARNCLDLLQAERWGLYNMVCGGVTSRIEVATELVDVIGLKDKVEIVPVDSSFFKEQYFAERPPSERLVNARLDLMDLNHMRDWRIALRDYVENYYSDYLE